MAQTLPEIVRQEVPGIDGLSNAPKKYPTFLGDKFIKDKIVEKITESGMSLTEEQKANLTVKNGVITSPDFVTLKKQLGINADNDAVNEQLESALKKPTVIASIKENMAAHVAKTQVATAPAPKPQADPATTEPASPPATAQAPTPQPQGPVAQAPATTSPTTAPEPTTPADREPAMAQAIEKLGKLAQIPIVKQFVDLAEQRLQQTLGTEGYDGLKTMVLATLSKVAATPEFGQITKTIDDAVNAMRDQAQAGRTPGIAQPPESQPAGRFDTATYQRALDSLKAQGMASGAEVLGALASPKVPDVRTGQGRGGAALG